MNERELHRAAISMGFQVIIWCMRHQRYEFAIMPDDEVELQLAVVNYVERGWSAILDKQIPRT